jgi:hypothetical protein
MPRLLVSALFISVFLVCAPLAAQNFRMETDVYLVGQKKPLCQTLTLFSDTMVYDFIYGSGGKKDDPPIAEITIFDMSSGRVILLDVSRELKTVLSHEQLIKLTTQMKVATTAEDAVYHFAANPNFKSEFNAEKLELRLKSENMMYFVTGQKAEQASAVARYREFADWSARLNACRPGNLPPFARIELGRHLAEHDILPQEIHRTTIAPGRLGYKRLELRTTHMVNWSISGTDRKRIDGVADQITKFDGVTFLSFIEPEKKK